MAGQSPASIREVAASLLEHAVTAADRLERTDLAERLRHLSKGVQRRSVRVLVVGEYKQGKSSLVNALAGVDVCPVTEDTATIVPVTVRWGSDAVAVAATLDDEGEQEVLTSVDALSDWVVEGGAESGHRRVCSVDVRVPAERLHGGLVLVDMPDVGGLASLNGAATAAVLPSADAVLFASDAGQPLTAAELTFLRRVAATVPMVALVKTRVDIHPHWPRILEADTLNARGIVHSSFAVSSELAAKAHERRDPELFTESHVPEVLSWLQVRATRDADRRQGLLATDEVETVVGALARPLDAERLALENPERAVALAADLANAQAAANRLRSAGGRWQQVLTDAFVDVLGDAEHRLRTSSRRLLAQAEREIDEIDPATRWEQYEPELRRQVTTLVTEHYDALSKEIGTAAERVAAVFSDDASGVDGLVRAASERIVAPSGWATDSPLRLTELKRRTIAGQMLVLLRSSYGGALMAGFVGSVMGLAVATPAALAAGLALGTKGVREENRRQLTQRRAQAKLAARRFVDDVMLEVNKDTRDSIRAAQRQLRDFFAAQAEEVGRSTTAALQAAQRGVEQEAGSRDTRLREVKAELERLEWLGERCRQVRGALAQVGTP